jgi:hypothetical protein
VAITRRDRIDDCESGASCRCLRAALPAVRLSERVRGS